MRVTAVFMDGSVIEAGSYVGLERELRADEWNPTKKRPFRRELALRAKNWSRTRVAQEGRSREFLRGLETAGILRLEVNDDGA